MAAKRRWTKVTFGKHSARHYTNETLEFLDILEVCSSIRLVRSGEFNHYGDKKWKIKVSRNKTVSSMVHVSFQDWRGQSDWTITLAPGKGLQDCYNEIEVLVEQWRPEVDVVPFGFDISEKQAIDKETMVQRSYTPVPAVQSEKRETGSTEIYPRERMMKVIHFDDITGWDIKKVVAYYMLNDAAQQEGEKQPDGSYLIIEVPEACVEWMIAAEFLAQGENGLYRFMPVEGMPTMEVFSTAGSQNTAIQQLHAIIKGMQREMVRIQKELTAVREHQQTSVVAVVQAPPAEQNDAEKFDGIELLLPGCNRKLPEDEKAAQTLMRRIGDRMGQFGQCKFLVSGYNYIQEVIKFSNTLSNDDMSVAIDRTMQWCGEELGIIEQQYIQLAKEWDNIEFLLSLLPRLNQENPKIRKAIEFMNSMIEKEEIVAFFERMPELTGIKYQEAIK